MSKVNVIRPINAVLYNCIIMISSISVNIKFVQYQGRSSRQGADRLRQVLKYIEVCHPDGVNLPDSKANTLRSAVPAPCKIIRLHK